MNGPTRLKLYEIIHKRDGEFCKGCCRSPLTPDWYCTILVLDHKDNNNSNNNPDNLQLLCKSCNYKKNPRRPVDECVSESESQATSELAVSRLKEPMFRNYVFTRVMEDDQVPEQDLIASASEHICISTVTGKRYLDKMCSSSGLYLRKRVGKTITIQFKKDLPLK